MLRVSRERGVTEFSHHAHFYLKGRLLRVYKRLPDLTVSSYKGGLVFAARPSALSSLKILRRIWVYG